MRAVTDATVVLIGAGGIGAPAAIALAAAGVRRLVVADDNLVEASNLHRQILFDERDLGRPKLEAFGEALARRGVEVEAFPSRALPENVRELVRRGDVVIDATDNFASRFMLADAARLEGVPIVHAAAVRLHATVMAVAAHGQPCYRCIFEDLPRGDAPDCATAGVLGPVCGVAGALAADLALSILAGATPSPFGFLLTFDGRRDLLRRVAVRPRLDCELCGAARTLEAIDERRYLGDACEGA